MKTKLNLWWLPAGLIVLAALWCLATAFFEATEKIDKAERARVAAKTAPSVRSAANKRKCQENLMLITGAKATWGIYNHYGNLDDVLTMDDLLPGELQRKLLTPKFLDEEVFCPGGGTYLVGALTNAPTCTVSGHTLP